ncbi:MAG: hypothetical protein MJA31_12525 [Clostridia bacterium]|nr:hypothetical protein [Clostridia bacterium]
MDVTKLNDVFFVYVPETILSILTIISLLDGRINFKCKSFYIKLIISNLMIIMVIIYARSNLYSIIYTTFFSTVIYILTYKIIYRYNWRQSIIGGGISIFTIMMLEMLTLPLITLLMNNIEHFSLFGNKIIFSMPVRILQLFLLFLISRTSFTLKDSYITINWKSLSPDKRIICTTLLLSIILAVTFGVNYIDMYAKTNTQNDYNFEELYNYIYSTQLDYQDFAVKMSETINDIGKERFLINLQMFSYSSIFLVTALFIFLVRTIKYEEYRNILKKTPDQLIRGILENSSHEELQKYVMIFLDEVQIQRLEQIEKTCEFFKKDLKKFTYHINENIFFAEIDYTKVMSYLGSFIEVIDKNLRIDLQVEKESNNVALRLKILEVSEIQHKVIENHISKLDIKRKLLHIGAIPSYKCIDNKIIFTITIPIQKYHREEVNTNEDKNYLTIFFQNYLTMKNLLWKLLNNK